MTYPIQYYLEQVCLTTCGGYLDLKPSYPDQCSDIDHKHLESLSKYMVSNSHIIVRPDIHTYGPNMSLTIADGYVWAGEPSYCNDHGLPFILDGQGWCLQCMKDVGAVESDDDLT